MRFISSWAFPRPLTTAILSSLSPYFTVATLIPSPPRTPLKAIVRSAAADLSEITRRSTASVTPPVTPKMTPAPLIVPKGMSTASGSSSENTMPDSFII